MRKSPRRESADSFDDDVFISYSREDQAQVTQIHQALADQGRSGWVDWEGIAPSEEWLATIHQAIDYSQAFIFVFSPQSIASTVCVTEELERAQESGKKIIPIVIEDVLPEQVPPAHRDSYNELIKRNFIFAREADDFQEAMHQLIQALETDFDHVRQHTEYLRSARLWDHAGRRSSFLLRGDALEEAATWVASVGGKEPSASQIQIDYIQQSRLAEKRRKRTVTNVLVFGLLTISGLAVFAVLGEQKARRQTIRAERAEKETAQQLVETNHQLGAVWLERAVKAPDRLSRTMHAARAVGFTNYGRDQIDTSLLDASFPVLLKPDSHEWHRVNAILDEIHYVAPVWISPSHPFTRGPFGFSENDQHLLCVSKNRSPLGISPSASILAYELGSGAFHKKLEPFKLGFTLFESAAFLRYLPEERIHVSSVRGELFQFDFDRESIVKKIPLDFFEAPQGTTSNSQSVSPCSRRLMRWYRDLAPSADGTKRIGVQVTSLTDLTQVMSLTFTKDGVEPVATAFSPDLSRMYIANEQNQVLEIDCVKGKVDNVSTHPEIEKTIAGISILRNGSIIALGSNGNLYRSSSFSQKFQPTLRNPPRAKELESRYYYNRIAMSPSEEWIAVHEEKGRVYVYDLKREKFILEEKNLPNAGTGIRFSPTGGYLLQGEVLLWNTENWTRLDTEVCHQPDIWREVRCSPSGRYVAAYNRPTTMMWDTVEHAVVTPIDASDASVSHASLSPDERFLARLGYLKNHPAILRMLETKNRIGARTLGYRSDGMPLLSRTDQAKQVHVISDASGAALFEFPMPANVLPRDISGIQLTGYGNFLTRSFGNKEVGVTLQIFDAYRGETVGQIPLPPDRKFSMSATGVVVKENTDGQLEVWNVGSGRRLSTLAFEKKPSFMGLGGVDANNTISPDGAFIATWQHPEHIFEIWEGTSGRRMTQLRGHRGIVENGAFTQNGRYFVSAAQDGRVIQWELRQLEKLSELVGTTSGTVQHLMFADDDQSLFSTGFGGLPTIWKPSATGWESTTFGSTRDIVTIRSAAIQGDLLLQPDQSTRNETLVLEFYDWRNNRLAKKLQLEMPTASGPLASVLGMMGYQDMKPLPNDRILATSMHEGILIIDTQSGKIVKSLDQSKGFLGTSVSADGRYAASELKNPLTLWDLETGKRLTHGGFADPPSEINNARFSPDGTRLAVALKENRVLVWNVASGERELELETNEEQSPTSLAWFGQQNLLFVGSADGSITGYDLATGKKTRSIPDAHSSHVSALAVDEARMAIASAGSTGASRLSQIKVWKLTGNEVPNNKWKQLPGQLIQNGLVEWNEQTGELSVSSRDNILHGNPGMKRAQAPRVDP